MRNNHLTAKERLQKLIQEKVEGDIFNPVDEGVDRILFLKLKETDYTGSRLASDIWFDIAFVVNHPNLDLRGLVSIPTLARMNHSSNAEVSRCLRMLEELKLIKVIKKGKGGKANKYAILWHPLFAEPDEGSL